MPSNTSVKFTRNFERTLEEFEHFLLEVEAPQAIDLLLDELGESVIPNLERFPDMSRPFLARKPRSVEAGNALERLQAQLAGQFTQPVTLREYLLASYLILHARLEDTVYLLAIKHHRQLSFDFESHWGST
ncbi:MAG: type II toxin-antitoxin system RelE/ParE family toxin [Thiobacillus sp.]|nr:type II toxin-antitoxin system RelE/ParE family toxin [Thiobacillus sp.]